MPAAITQASQSQVPKRHGKSQAGAAQPAASWGGCGRLLVLLSAGAVLSPDDAPDSVPSNSCRCVFDMQPVARSFCLLSCHCLLGSKLDPPLTGVLLFSVLVLHVRRSKSLPCCVCCSTCLRVNSARQSLPFSSLSSIITMGHCNSCLLWTAIQDKRICTLCGRTQNPHPAALRMAS